MHDEFSRGSVQFGHVIVGGNVAGNGAAVALAVSVTTALVKALFNAVVFDVNRFMRCAVLTRRPGLQLTAPIMVVGNAITDGAHDELHSEGP